MTGFDLTPDEEKQLERELSESYNNFQARKQNASPALAQNMSNFYQRFPYAPFDALAPTVQAFTDGKMSEKDAVLFLEDLTKKMANEQAANAPKKEKKKSWWQRNISDKVKTGSRWAMAGLNFVPQAVTNLASMGYQAGKQVQKEGWGSFDDAWSTEGFIISTDLGTLLDNDETAGEGYFVGGRAAQAQAQRARDFRGTIADKAFTIGRGSALVFYQPGTAEYNRLSGIVDAAAAIAVPSVPGGKAVTGLVKYGAEAAAAQTGMRSLAGLRGFESALIIPSKVNDFLNSSAGRSVVKRMTEIGSVDEAIEVFPTADVTWLNNVAKISDETEMRQFINDSIGIGDETLGTAPKSVDDWNISRWDTIKINGLKQRESLAARMMATVPGRHVVIAGGSEREKLQSVKNIKNYLRQLRIDPDTRMQLVDDFANALATDDGSMKNVVNQLENIISTSLKANGVSDQLAKQMLSGIKDFKTAYEKALYGAIGDSGDSADFGGIFEVIVNGKIVSGSQPLNTAGLQSEMLRHSMMLPDPRETRRIMSNIGWVTGKTGKFDPLVKGEQRLPFTAVEWIQNQLWRPLTLLTGGYVLRNMSDSLLRQSFNPNVRTGIFHPFELIQVAMYKRFKGDILGETFKGDPEALVRGSQREMAEAVSGSLRETRDAVSVYSRQEKTGVWKRVRRSDGANEFSNGVAAELALLASDEAAAMAARGDTVDDIVNTLASDPKKDYLTKLQNRWKNKTVTLQDGTKSVGTVEFIDSAGNVNINNVRTYVERYVLPRVESVTGGSNTLKQMVGFGTFTDAIGDDLEVFLFDEIGRVIGYNEDNLFPALKGVIDNPNVALKESYKVQETFNSYARRPNDPRSQFFDSWDRAVDKFFSELYPKREAWLNRSPVFRQFYYDTVGRLIDDMAENEVGRVVNNILNVAASQKLKFANETAERIWVGKYIGNAELSDKMFDIRNGTLTTGGSRTVDQIDAYAKGFALDETKRLFYNAAEKSNFADILRVIVPFGSAWAEVTKKWAGMLSSDPEVLKRVGVTVQGLQEADPNNDGKGFFYKDPNTGEYVFNYPFSDQLAPFVLGAAGAATGGIGFGLPGLIGGAALGGGIGAGLQTQLGGLDTTFTAPVRSLSMGLSLIPGLSPYVQWGAAEIIKDKPEADFIAKIIMPYGQPDVSFVTLPSWAKKVAQAITANPESDRLFGDLKIDVMKALVASGKYDTTTELGILKLEKDAATKARVLLVLQGLGQFTGPSRPKPEFTIPTNQGDTFASEVSKAWYEMRTANFETAVEDFLETFGDDVFAYMQSKTVSSTGGLDASKEFGEWEADNSDLFSKYPEVASYFAPVGSTFDYRVYVRQLESGKRQRLSAKEVLAEAQARVGIAMYRRVARRIGPKPNEQQQDMLRAYREELGKKFPGFRDRAIDIKSLETKINRLYSAVDDPNLSDNPIADALKTYFGYRDEAIKVAQDMGLAGLSGKKAAELRNILRQVGNDLSDSTPEFERLWEQVLFDEVDLLA